MSVIGKRTIYVGPAGDNTCKPVNLEGIAKVAIAPGTVLKQLTDGLDASDIAAAIYGQEFIVADKDQMRSRSVDDAWTVAENMVAIRPRSGELVNVLVATAQALIVGTALTRNGAGLLTIAATTAEEIVAYSDEEVTTVATQLVRVTPA